MSEQLLNVLAGGLLLGAVYGLIATGLNIIFGVMRVVNFAHGEMVVIGMYVGYWAWSLFGLAPLLALPVAAVVLFVIGYAFQRTLGNRFLSAPQHVQFLLFIGLGLVITGLNAVLFGPEPRGIQSPASFEVYRVAGLRLDATRVHAATVALILTAALALWLRLSLTGKALKAAAANLVGGQAIGIRIPHLFAVTAGIGAACAGCAGVLVAPFFDTQPYLAADYTLLAFITVIVGGLASLPGALVGGLLIGLAEALAAYLVAPSLKSLFSYALLIIVILARPVGLFGKAGDGQ